MARIPLDSPRGPLARTIEWAVRRRFGGHLDPVRAAGHHRGVLITGSFFELGVGRWRRLTPSIQLLAVMATAVRLGCDWCVDFGSWSARGKGVPPEKIAAVPRWRDSDHFDDTERLVLAYAEAMTDTPVTVTDEMVAGLRRVFTDAQLVELTTLIAVENMRARTNHALGITSQGFDAACALPASPPSER
ncbi:AhpD family alkylhydroperoxidase [Stackebrandtia albiflava]|uniref:AhpD family alkylhydroperoxidase n=1 Tax=Stackebrandtia albiflava TaxID=406432 RepID=A0A562VCM8_9ACTN|nr:carboxymuconolactone decarboxylase family protein [Stackebrandtia albiflava]TWJ15615.1 AhpD family alkylhydroperoxidase [Stackebrandtia albiflava]